MLAPAESVRSQECFLSRHTDNGHFTFSWDELTRDFPICGKPCAILRPERTTIGMFCFPPYNTYRVSLLGRRYSDIAFVCDQLARLGSSSIFICGLSGLHRPQHGNSRRLANDIHSLDAMVPEIGYPRSSVRASYLPGLNKDPQQEFRPD